MLFISEKVFRWLWECLVTRLARVLRVREFRRKWRHIKLLHTQLNLIRLRKSIKLCGWRLSRTFKGYTGGIKSEGAAFFVLIHKCFKCFPTRQFNVLPAHVNCLSFTETQATVGVLVTDSYYCFQRALISRVLFSFESRHLLPRECPLGVMHLEMQTVNF